MASDEEMTFVGNVLENGDQNGPLFLFQARSGVKFEEDDVTIFDDIFLSLLPVSTRASYTG